MKRQTALEHHEQVSLMAWVDVMVHRLPDLALLYAVPNGGLRSKKTAADLRAEGVRPGVPDLHLPVARCDFHSLYIEMKRVGMSGKKHGGRSEEQVKWHARLREHGHAVCTCYGWDNAAKALRTYLQGTLAMPSDGDSLMVGR